MTNRHGLISGATGTGKTVTLQDLMPTDFSGQGVISLLDATRLHVESPGVYTSFLLWLITQLSIGEALVSTLSEDGSASPVKRVLGSLFGGRR